MREHASSITLLEPDIYVVFRQEEAHNLQTARRSSQALSNSTIEKVEL